ncbi:O-antigen export protein [Prevotella corporis]|uniref:lipopolysaccharide biosynthesis protein n=2 Tax=Prevotella corporis TaxID=28128 RepID=UPI0003F639D3
MSLGIFRMIINKGINQFISTDGRSKMLKSNILYSAILKVIGLITSLLVVTITLNYLNSELYGVWLTITSILYWFSFFDIGLGNGMRNYLTEAVSKGNYKEAQSYLSTTIIALTMIASIIAIVGFILLKLLNLNSVFNTNTISNTELQNVLFVAIGFTLILFVLKNIGYVFVALQKYALWDFINTLGNIIGLLIIFLLTKFTNGKLIYVVFAFTCTPAIIYILAAIPIFSKYPEFRPTIQSFRKDFLSTIVGKGLGFFLIQITSCLVIYGSSNLFITQFCGPESVTTYNIAYKFFNLLAIGYLVFISPMWNAYTDAYVKQDFNWIEKAFKSALKIWLFTEFAGIIMLIVSQYFYLFWVGKAVHVPFMVSLSVFLYISFFNLNNCVTYLLNGLNKIYIQIITSITATFIYLTIMFVWGKNMNIQEIVFYMSAAYGTMTAIHFYQCRKLIKQKATGIWNK